MFPTLVGRKIASFAAAMVVGMAIVQGLIVANGQHITWVTQAALAFVALGYMAFFVTHYLEFRRVRFALMSSHAIGYVIVNGSFWLHAAYLWASGQGQLVDSGWYGVLFGMSICWGAGLAAHAWLIAHGHGFEDATIA